MGILRRLRIPEAVWRALQTAALVYLVVYMIVPSLLESLHDDGIISDIVRRRAHLTSVGVLLVASALVGRWVSGLEPVQQLLAWVIGGVSVYLIPDIVAIIAAVPSGGSGDGDSSAQVVALSSAIQTTMPLLTSVWCFYLVWRKSELRDRKTDAHNERMEKGQEESLRVLRATEANSRSKSRRRFGRR